MSAFLVSKKASGIVLGDPKDFVGLRGLQGWPLYLVALEGRHEVETTQPISAMLGLVSFTG